jgi:hypothetical protein
MSVTKTFQCETCSQQGNNNVAAFRGHLRDVHGVDPDHLTGTKELLMHVNAGRHHTSVHRVALDEGVIFIATTVSEKGTGRK